MKTWALLLAGVFILSIAFFSTSINLTGSASTSYNLEYGKYYPEEIALNVDHAGCKWKEDHYEACVQVSWKGPEGYYSKAFIAGGEGLLYSTKQYLNPYIYCQNVGANPAVRQIQAYLHAQLDALKRVDVDTSVTCDKDQEPKTKKVSQRYSITIGTEDRARNSGSKTFNGLTSKPVSCKISGSWNINNRRQLGGLKDKWKFCTGATGSFNGYFEQGNSYVVDDPDLFDWRHLGATQALDPSPTTYPGYILYAPTCDQGKYYQGRYYARAKVVEFIDDGFVVDWEYYNSDTRPTVNFIFTADCEVETGELKKPKLAGQPVVEQPIVEVPSPSAPEPVTTETQIKPRPLIFKLIDWLRSVF